mgnify:CR=1 FL=1
MDDLISRHAAIKQILLCENHDMEHDFEFNEGLIVAMNAVEKLPTADPSEYCDKLWKTAYERGKAEPEIKPIEYRDCANAMLRMWMDNVVTDGEYNRIMDKLNAYWG